MPKLVFPNKRLSVLLIGTVLFAAVVSSVSLKYSLGRAARLEADLFDAELVEIEELKAAFDEQRNYLLLLGRVGRRNGQTFAFEKSCRRKLAAFTSLPRHTEVYPAFVAEAHFRHAQLSALGSNLQEVQQHLARAIDVAESIGDLRLVAFSRNLLGATLVDLTEYQAAESEFAQAAKLLESVPNQRLMHAIALRNLGLVRRAMGQSDMASIEAAARTLQVQAGDSISPSRECWIDCQMALSELLIRQGEFRKAQDIVAEIKSALRELQNATNAAFFDPDIVSYGRYASAIGIVDELEVWLTSRLAGSAPKPLAWNWRWLMNLPTETISQHAAEGATMCAEFDPQSGLLTAWDGHREVNRVTLEVAKLVGDRVPVSIIVADSLYDEAQAALKAANIPDSHYRLHIYNVEAPWLRDLGPIPGVAEDGTPVWFDSHVVRDQAKQRISTDNVPAFLAPKWTARLQETALWIEGGAVQSNGKGLTICSTLVRQGNRNYGMTDAQIDRELRRVTGTKQNVYLEPLEGEPTGHVDMFATLVGERTVVVGQYADRNSTNGRILEMNAQRLERTVYNGKYLDVVRVPMPREADNYFRTYTNVVFANGVLLVPSWNDSGSDIERAMESEVRQTYARLLPNWDIAFVDCSKLAVSEGALHCLVTNLGTAQPKFSELLQP